MPAMGLEPIRGCPQQILSLPRLPFRHAGISQPNITVTHPAEFFKWKSQKTYNSGKKDVIFCFGSLTALQEYTKAV